MPPNPLFSIIIPTRNRPGLFRTALQSVLMQDCPSLEVIVVNDGSDDEHKQAYQEQASSVGERGRFFDLPQSPRGHGQSYALNFGASQARGDYVGFLDDDDEWTDPGYLSRVERTVRNSPQRVDLHLADQKAYANGELLPQVTWIEDLKEFLPASAAPDEAGAFTVIPAELFRCAGFCHLNTTLVHAGLFAAMGGFDDNIRYECDRDFYLRAVDQAALIKYGPAVVSRHNVPNPKLRTNMSTAVSDIERRLFQIRVLDKAIALARSPEVRRHGELHKGYTLKKIAQELARGGAYGRASYYAREALLVGFNPKWLAYTAWLGIRAGFARGA